MRIQVETRSDDDGIVTYHQAIMCDFCHRKITLPENGHVFYRQRENELWVTHQEQCYMHLMGAIFPRQEDSFVAVDVPADLDSFENLRAKSEESGVTGEDKAFIKTPWAN